MSLQNPRVARRPQLGVDLTAVGARPGVHGALGAVAARAFDGERLARLVHRADRGRLDLVVLGDGLLLHPGRRQVAGRLDAAVAAARVAPLVRTAALVAGVPHHRVDPGHLAGAIRGVQGAAGGPAGWQVSGPAEQEAGGADAWAARAEEAVLAVLAAWAVADPGAVRRDDEGRFRVDHDGIRFAVRGRTAPAPAAAAAHPAPRPLVVVPVAGPESEALAGRYADVARLTAPDLDAAAAARARVRSAAVAAGRAPDAVQVLLDVDVALADDRGAATARLDLVRSVEQPDLGVAGAVVAGTGEDLATILSTAVGDGAVDGFVARPTSPETDLTTLVDRVVPTLRLSAAPPVRPAARRAPAAPRLTAQSPSGPWSAAPFALT